MNNIYTRGSGTEEDPYLVSNLEQLDAIRHNLNKHFVQIANLDIGNEEWEPIGEVYADDTPDEPFNGSYDGNGYFIKNVKVDKPLQISVGLFSFVGENGNIKNLEVSNYDLRGNDGVGAIIGLNNGVISSSHVFNGKTKGNKYTGGIVGINNGTIINCCTQEETLVDGEKISGGLVGLNEGEIRNSYSIAEVINNDLAGGLFGDNNGEVVASYYDQEKSQIKRPGAKEEKTSQELSDNGLYEDWDFDSKWKMYQSLDGLKYPKLNILKDNYSDFAGGSGSADDPYLISNGFHINKIRDYLDSHFKQIKDVDISDYYNNWDPIGNFDSEKENNNISFNGIYDGNGYRIISFSIDKAKNNGQALFANVGSSAVLKNISIDHFSIKGSESLSELAGLATFNAGEIYDCSIKEGLIKGVNIALGGLVAYNVGRIENCIIHEVSLDGDFIGGLVGINDNGEIINSHSNGVLDGQIAGGLVGMNQEGKIYKSTASGEIYGKDKIGGLVGQNTGILKKCKTEVNIIGRSEIGGLIGLNGGEVSHSISGGTISLNINQGDVNSIKEDGEDENYYIGGFVGINSGNIKESYSVTKIDSEIKYNCFVGEGEKDLVEGCYYDKDLANQVEFNPATPKSTSQLKKKSTFVDWDFEKTWKLEPNQYPSFQE